MAQGIARYNSLCRVCGAGIVADIHKVTWAPAFKGSTRHTECYGKPDQFDIKGKAFKVNNLAIEIEGEGAIPIEGKVQSQPHVEGFEGFEIDGESESDTGAPKAPKSPAKSAAPDMSGVLGPLAAAIEQYVKDAVAKQGPPKDSMKAKAKLKAELKAELEQELQGKATVTIQVRNNNDTVTTMEGLQHREMPKLLNLIGLRKNVYMLGPTGSGKSTAAKKAAAAIKTESHPDGLPFYYVSLNPQSSPTRIEGYQTPHGEYVSTLFARAYEQGGVFCADEADNAMANLWTSINNAIDSDLGSFPNGILKRHKDFVFIGTGNTNLSGDAVYRDRKALDKATISRFVFLNWDYDEALEKAITLGRNNKAMPWLTWVHKVRAYAKTNNPALFAYTHPRACYDGADLLGAGFPVNEVADMTLFKHTFDNVLKQAVLSANPLPKEVMTIQ